MISIVADASVAFQWFRADDEKEAEPSGELARLFGDRTISLSVLDLTRYEIGNAFLRGWAKASGEHTAVILDALSVTCPSITPTGVELIGATRLAEQHRLTMYDATYAAVARSRGAQLATLDKALLKAGLGRRPSEIVAMVGSLG